MPNDDMRGCFDEYYFEKRQAFLID